MSSIEVQELRARVSRLQDQIGDLETQIWSYKRAMEDEEAYAVAFASAFVAIQDRAVEIFVRNATDACLSSGEYAHPYFIDALISAVRHPDSLLIEHLGYTGRVNVIIDLDRTAGPLEEYAQAVSAVRGDRRDVHRNQTPPNLASRMWAEKIYRAGRMGGKVSRRRWNRETRSYDRVDVTDQFVGKYWETVFARAAFFIHPAPWWRLLDGGNVRVQMSSDIGGTPYPRVPATRFVENTRREIKAIAEELIQADWSDYIDRLQYRISEVRSVIRRLESEIEELERRIATLEQEVFEPKPPKYEEKKVIAEELLRERLKELYPFAKPERIQYLLDELARGVNVGRIRMGSHEGKEIRVRVTSILQKIDKELGD